MSTGEKVTATATTTTTADFWVGCTIGEGADGRVVHARLKSTGKDVAIKVVTKLSIQKDKQLLGRVWKERELLSSKLKSEHVVGLWASFHDSECLYLVMECASEGDLKHLIHHGMLSLPQWTPSIPSYALQLLSALEFLHTQNLVHGDLKPDNVLVTANGTLKLADFGCAVDLLSARDGKPAVAMGTADYASPQIIRAETPVTVDCDLWAFGCILYAMWEGESPFHDETDALAVRRICDYTITGDLKRGRNIQCDAWMALIQDLLTPDSAIRLGMVDFESRGKAGVKYTSIRSRDCLTVSASEIVPFRAPAPAWWEETQTSRLKDGAAGWISFLL